MNTSIDFGVRGGNTSIIEIDTRKHDLLVRDFDKQLDIRKRNLLDLGRIARDLKALHVTHGQRQKGKGWEAFLAERGLDDRTVDRWIEAYEVANNLRRKETVRDKVSRTNDDNKGVSLSEPSGEDEIDSDGQSEPDVSPVSEAPAPSPWLDTVNSKDNSKVEGRSNVLFKTADNSHFNTREPAPANKALPFDTAEKRKEHMFRQAVLALDAANVYTDSPRMEWEEVDQRVRQWLASYAVDNTVPTRNINHIQQQEQED